LFLELRDASDEERKRRLGETPDAQVREEVASLLGFHVDEPEDPFLQRAAASAIAAPRDELIGKILGRYRIIRLLGRGGMGSVYLGQRDDEQFSRRVAVKVIRPGADSEEVVRRFRLERRALAALDHPNIARLLDAGLTDDDRPYFVMEYVDGAPLDEHLKRRNPPIRERLALFREICAAVHHAHQNLIVHRDLKPGNILVTADGLPKLVDFGIAKLLNPDLSPVDAPPTAVEHRVLTPAYASPEQIRGEHVSAASDVYALGVILFEMLTGQRPYELATGSRAELERAICDQQPFRPSTRCATGSSGAATATTSPRWRRALEGDLDTIALRALSKEPQRRYASAHDLSEDIRRHLAGLPVVARPDSAAYLASKFIRRHRAGVLTTATFAVALVAALVLAVWQGRAAARNEQLAIRAQAAAEERYDLIRAYSEAFLNDFYDAVAPLAGSMEARQLLAETALAQLEELRSAAAKDPVLRLDLLRAHERVGDIMGGLRYGSLGRTDDAIDRYREAIALLEPVVEDHERHAARIRLKLADLLHRQGLLAESERLYRQAVTDAEAAAPYEVRDERLLAVALLEHGDALRDLGRLDEAEQQYRRSMDARERALTAHPDDEQTLRDVATGLTRLASLAGDRGDLDRAIELNEQVLEIRRRILQQEGPEEGRGRRAVAIALRSLGRSLIDVGRVDDAAQAFEEMSEITNDLREADPTNRRAQLDHLLALEGLGDSHKQAGDAPAARRVYEELRDLASEELLKQPNDRYLTSLVDSTSAKLGDLELAAGRPNVAIVHYEHYARAAGQQHARIPESAPAARNHALALHKLAEAYQASGDSQRAAETARRAIRLVDEVLQRDAADARSLRRRAFLSADLALWASLSGASDARVHLDVAVTDLNTLRASTPDHALSELKDKIDQTQNLLGSASGTDTDGS
jgi:tetratricopeptide (TPR) repeat protein